jgi:hypothetical protein
MSTASETAAPDEATASADATAPRAENKGPRWAVLVVAGLCALTLALRALIGLRSGVWRDEAQLLFIVDEPSWAAMLDFLRQHESHPPLFYAVMRVWLSITGGSDAAALALPIVLGGALVPALYVVGTRLLSWRAGLLAAAAAAVSPILAGVGAMARPYSLLPLLTLAGTYALVRAIQRGGRLRWAGYAAAMLALVYTHNWGWLVLAAHWVALALCLWRGVPRPRVAVLRGWAGAQAAVAIGYLAWLPSFRYQTAHAGYSPFHVFGRIDSPSDVATGLLVLAVMLLSATLLPFASSAIPAAAVGWALLVTVLAVVVGRRPRESRRRPPGARTAVTIIAATPLVAMGVAVLLSPRSDLLVPQCLAMLAPLLLLLVAGALARSYEMGQRRLATVAAAALLAGYAALLVPLYQDARSNARELAAAVAAQAAPSDLLVVTPWWLASPFNRYYSPPTEQLDFPALTRVGAIPYDDEIRRLRDPDTLVEAERRIEAGQGAGRRLWFVSATDATPCKDAPCQAKILASTNFSQVGDLRAGQLRAYVERLYGPPVRCETHAEAGARLESLTACLFQPS